MLIHKKNKKKRLIMLFFSLIIIFLLCIQFFVNFNFDNKTKLNTFPLYIKSVSSKNNILLIWLYEAHSIEDIKNVLDKFVIRAIAFKMPLILLNDSIIDVIQYSNYSFGIVYDFPFIMQYSSCFFEIYDRKPFIPLNNEVLKIDISKTLKNPIKSYHVSFMINDFNKDTNTSQLLCYGNNPLDRWCEMKRIWYLNTRIVFCTNAFYKFPSPFLSIGCRAPPFDIIEDRLNDEPIVTHLSFSTISQQYGFFINHDNISYVVGRFHNSMMLWHVIFDFLIPAYWTIMKVEGKFRNANRSFFLRDSQEHIMWDFVSFLSEKEIINIKNDPTPRFFQNVIVGLPKFEKNIDENRVISDMIRFDYQFNEDVAVGLREAMLNSFDPHEEIRRQLNDPYQSINELNHKNPIVIFIERGDSKRDVINTEEIIHLMQNTCKFCDIKKILPHLLTPQMQIEMISEASALVGVHGSGLTHAVWLPRSNSNFSSALLEILPYQYWCRDWYKVAADVAGAKYFSTMNSGRILPLIPDEQSKLKKMCYNHPKMCYSIECNDFLKDQSFEMELDVFNESWMNIVKILEHNRKNAI